MEAIDLDATCNRIEHDYTTLTIEIARLRTENQRLRALLAHTNAAVCTCDPRRPDTTPEQCPRHGKGA